MLQVTECDSDPHFLALPEGSGISFTEALYGRLRFLRYRLIRMCRLVDLMQRINKNAGLQKNV